MTTDREPDPPNPPPAQDAAPGAHPFVGRTAERAALAAHLAAAQRGNGRLVLLSGEPGVGKTRLVEQACLGVSRARVLWGRCHDNVGAPAFWPWTQAFRDYVRATPPERLRRELGDEAAEVARLVPAVRTRCPDVPAPPAEAADDPGAARFRLFDAVTMWLRAVTEDEVLVVVLDDLHWADSESLLLLAFVAREIDRLRLLVLGTYRAAELRQAAAATDALADLARASHRLPLAGLTADDVGDYVRAVSGAPPAAETVDAILRTSDGNAFCMTEVVALLHTRGELATALPRGARIELPDGVREVIRGRLAALSAQARAILEAGAVLGREFEVELLARIVELPVDAVLRELAPAVGFGLVQESAEQRGVFRFAHALLQDALVVELEPDARARLHRAAAVALEAAPEAEPGDIAHHYFEAAPLGTLPRAIEVAVEAGERAYARLGYEEAAGHFERALQACRRGAASPEQRLGILLPLGRAQRAAGDDEGARASFIEAAQLARELHDAWRFPEAVLAAAAYAETGTVDWPLVALLEEALEIVGPESRWRRAKLLAQLSRSLYFADVARRKAYSAEAVEIARGLDAKDAQLAAVRAYQFALWEPGYARERCALGAEMLALATELRDATMTAEAYTWRIVNHLELGDMAAVYDALRRYRELVAATRLPRERWRVTVIEAALALLAGRVADAERLAQRATALLAPSPTNNVAMFYAVQLYFIHEMTGRMAALDPLVQATAEQAVTLPVWDAALALLHAMLGRHDAARALLDKLAAVGFANLPRDGNLLGTYARIADASAWIGEPRYAEALLPLLAPYADAVVVLGTPTGCLGSAAHYAGLAAATLGALDDAVAHFERAIAVNERVGALPHLARSQDELARCLRARGAAGDAERAATLEAAAQATATRLGTSLRAGGAGGAGTVGAAGPAGAAGTAAGAGAQTTDAAGAASGAGVGGSRGAGTEGASAAGGVGGAAAAPLAPGASATAGVTPSRRTARFEREGDVWTVACGDEQTLLKDSRGAGYLAALLRHPGQELHALHLGGASVAGAGDAGEALDADARRAYQARLVELREELAEAESFNDVGRQARLREETEMLAAELTRATGLGGRSRKVASDAERARVNVTRAVRSVIRKIEVHCPALGRHLARSVQTGLFCSYDPDPAFPVDWQV